MLLVILHLLPIWCFKYFPSQDGPAHLHNASVLREYYFLEYSTFREYYLLNKNLTPNWFSHLALAGLMQIVPPLIAQKLLLSGYIILLPVSIRYTLYAIRPDAKFLYFLAFPFIYNYVLHMGFYNFSYSMAMFFFVVGYWLKHQNQFTLGRVIGLSVLSLLLYFCHLFSLVTAYVAIAILTLWLMVLELTPKIRQQQLDWHSLSQVLQRRVLAPLGAFLPTLILVVLFLSRKSAVNSELDTSKLSWKHLSHLLSLHSLVSFQQPEFFLSIVLAGLFAAICLYVLVSKRHHQINAWDGFLLVVVAYVLMYFIAPDKISGGGNIKQRLLLYPYFGLILWFGAQSYHWVVKQRIQLVAVGISLILLGVHTIQYAELNSYLEEYVSGMHLIEPNTTLLPLSFSPAGHTQDGNVLSRRVKPFSHTSGYIAAHKKDVVVLTNYQAALDYFPILFRSKTNPFLHLSLENQPSKADWGIEAEPPKVDFLSYPQRTGGQVDYVLLWQVLEEHRNLEATKSIFKQLEEGYELIYTSPKRGFMELYRRKDWEKRISCSSFKPDCQELPNPCSVTILVATDTQFKGVTA